MFAEIDDIFANEFSNALSWMTNCILIPGQTYLSRLDDILLSIVLIDFCWHVDQKNSQKVKKKNITLRDSDIVHRRILHMSY